MATSADLVRRFERRKLPVLLRGHHQVVGQHRRGGAAAGSSHRKGGPRRRQAGEAASVARRAAIRQAYAVAVADPPGLRSRRRHYAMP